MPNKQIVFKEGEKHWNLTIISKHGRIGKCIAWKCRCDCGKEVVIRGTDIQRGTRKSCGCNKRKKRGPRPDVAKKNKENAKYEYLHRPTYQSWQSMKARCLNQNDKDYHNYGERGITVCDDWIIDYNNFLKDMGQRPKGKTIDRIDVNGDYEKENCRWATPLQQCNNTRKNIYVTYLGEELSASQMARKYGIETKTFIYRIKHGWSIEKALLTPPLIKRRKKSCQLS